MSPHDEGALSARALSASYGSLVVCRDITLDVKPGEVVALIGPNGAGKTSFIGALTGAVAAKGEVALGPTRLDGRPIHSRTRLGLATVPDNRGLFAPLTVAENLRLGAMCVPRERRSEAIDRAMAYFPFLAERGTTLAGSLSGGQQQMLAIAKCLAGAPRALLLDEPSQGLAPIILDEIVKVIGELKARRLPVLLVEQNYGLVERTADRFAVMVGGRIVMSGGKTELADRDRIGRLFLERRRATPTVH
ncbi:MAG: ABC transporter ATP-binding protein [Ideonella sp.]|nr:ABC transporter ATP-binding protein [Ideonella sp.]